MVRSPRQPNHPAPDRAARKFAACTLACLLTAGAQAIHAQSAPADGQQAYEPRLSPTVAAALDDPLASERTRRAMLIFHGQWNRVDAPSRDEQAAIALARWELNAPVFHDEAVDPVLRAHAAWRRGEPTRVLQLLQADTATPQALLLRARALLLLDDAAAATDSFVGLLKTHRDDLAPTADDRVAAAEALSQLIELGARPPSELRTVMAMLASAQLELDRLHYPALEAQAALLVQRHNRAEAAEVLAEALTLNPRASTAWRLLGQLYADAFDFVRARSCVAALRAIHPDHPLAAALEARIALQQKDGRGALDAIEPFHTTLPTQRDLLAVRFAAAALADDVPVLDEVSRVIEHHLPGDLQPALEAGRYLLLARRYPAAERFLRQVIERRPANPLARAELGLLLMDDGREPAAREQLEIAVRLDPYHVRATNHLRLLEQLLTWPSLDTEHFRILYAPGIHAVLARDIARFCEAAHDRVVAAFSHTPVRKTQIQLLPDQSSFAVRIVGLPDIWTVAASTGPVIALSPPRLGADQRGPFDIRRVIEHEYVHTVTLDATDYHIAHWLTEGLAVWQERAPRDFPTCQLLAAAVREDALIPLDRLTWAFVRPESPSQRPLAYAQSHWLIEYLVERFGMEIIARLIDDSRQAGDDRVFIEAATGEDVDTLMSAFTTWATRQVEAWGLGPASAGRRDALRLAAMYALGGDDAAAAVTPLDPAAALAALRAYRTLCPVDPWPHRALLRLPAEVVTLEERLTALRFLAPRSLDDGTPAYVLAQQLRESGDFQEAQQAINTALSLEPYRPAFRERAAAIALERNDRPLALEHLQALTLLEPDHPRHFVRLAALYAMTDQPDLAADAARYARTLDPDAPVDRFMPTDP